jgi:hypothetical protein
MSTHIYVIHEFGLTTALRRTAQTRYPDGVESVGTQVGSSRGSAGEFLRLLSRCRNGTWTELEGTFVGRGVPSDAVQSTGIAPGGIS